MVAALLVVTIAARRDRPTNGWFLDDAWQAVAALAPIGQLPTTGQTQPGFTFLQAIVTRVAGTGDLALVSIPLLAGLIGPPALYVVLRRCSISLPVAALTATVLVASPIHIHASWRLKAYTTELVVVLALVVLVNHLASSRWDRRVALAWVAGTALVAALSSFALLAAACAGLALLTTSTGDRRWRAVAVGGSAVASLAVLSATRRTYATDLVARNWDTWGGMVDPWPAHALPWRLGAHLSRVAEAFLGHRGWLAVVVVLVAVPGLVELARRGPHVAAGRFLGLTVVVAAAGSLAGSVPFGPRAGEFHRVSLWLFPAVAFGVAASIDRARTALTSTPWRPVVDGGIAVSAVAVLVAGLPADVRFQPGSRAEVHEVMARLGPDDAVIIPRHTTYSFALDAGVGYEAVPQHEAIVGFRVRFHDDRLVPISWGSTPELAVQQIRGAERVFVVSANLGALGREDLRELALLLTLSGYEVEANRPGGPTSVVVWQAPR